MVENRRLPTDQKRWRRTEMRRRYSGWPSGLVVMAWALACWSVCWAEADPMALYRHIATLSANGMREDVRNLNLQKGRSRYSEHRENAIATLGGSFCTQDSCTADIATCGSGHRCTVNDECTADADTCTYHQDCTKHFKCTSGKYCTGGEGNSGCTRAYFCTVFEPGSRSWCTYGDACTDGQVCTGAKQCTNQDCTQGEYCTGGARCTSTEQGKNCTAGDYCTSGRGCTAGDNCTQGQLCTKDSVCTRTGNCTKVRGCTNGAGCTLSKYCSNRRGNQVCPLPTPSPTPSPSNASVLGIGICIVSSLLLISLGRKQNGF
ncbi:MAG: hypothetical protein KatS3mg019_1727 [Fimbriimonadales bacterium]|nr:MAG: hypothetical protein KatS3mg019_1727 [Fimbriimonadales bacterium]